MGVSEIKELVEKQFNIETATSTLSAYNPETMAGAELDPKLKALHKQERETYQNEVDRIPTANQAYRLEIIDRQIHALLAQPKPNRKLIAELVEQQSRERGGMYTNRQQQDLNIKGAVTVVRVPAQLPKDQWEQQARQSKKSTA